MITGFELSHSMECLFISRDLTTRLFRSSFRPCAEFHRCIQCPEFELCGAIWGNIPNSRVCPSDLPSFMYVLLPCYMKIKVVHPALAERRCVLADS